MSDTTAARQRSIVRRSWERSYSRLSTRERRALALFRERGSEIVRIAPHTYRMPSASNRSVYFTTIKPGEESCTCPDYIQHGDAEDFFCKHMFAALIWHSKSGECFGCGAILLGRDLIEVMDWHESLTFFEGDQLCEECAVGHGLL